MNGEVIMQIMILIIGFIVIGIVLALIYKKINVTESKCNELGYKLNGINKLSQTNDGFKKNIEQLVDSTNSIYTKVINNVENIRNIDKRNNNIIKAIRELQDLVTTEDKPVKLKLQENKNINRTRKGKKQEKYQSDSDNSSSESSGSESEEEEKPHKKSKKHSKSSKINIPKQKGKKNIDLDDIIAIYNNQSC